MGKEMRSLIFGIALAIAWATAGQAQEWHTVPCDGAPLRFTPDVTCAANNFSRAGTGGTLAVSTYHGIHGWAAGTMVRFILVNPVGETYIRAYTNADAMRAIKTIDSEVSQKGEAWGELRHIGSDVSYMTFKMNKMECVGIDRAGPMYGYGYAWQLVGHACKPDMGGSAETFVKAILADIRVRK